MNIENSYRTGIDTAKYIHIYFFSVTTHLHAFLLMFYNAMKLIISHFIIHIRCIEISHAILIYQNIDKFLTFVIFKKFYITIIYHITTNVL